MLGVALAVLIFMVPSQPTQVVDFFFVAPKFKLFNNSTTVLSIQLKNNSVAVSGTGYEPYFWVANSATNMNPISGTCAWTTQTSAVFTATFTSNGLPAAGVSWVYGCGLSNTSTGAKTTFNQGKVDIDQDLWRP